jgi:AcrR family transcriptional regulator
MPDPIAAAEGLPEPPWRERKESPRTPLTRQAIVEAALRVLDRDGMDAVSMRKVGEELGTGAASLYWHVRNKEELLQLVFETVSEEAALPAPDPAQWQAQLRGFASELRRTMNRHRDVARISLGRIPAGPTLARTSEWLFALLQPAGIPDQVIAHLGDLMALYIGAFAFEESLGVASPTGEDLPPDEIIKMFRDYVESLPDDRFPRTKDAVDLLFGGGNDERFEFGLDVMIRGLETYATT